MLTNFLAGAGQRDLEVGRLVDIDKGVNQSSRSEERLENGEEDESRKNDKGDTVNAFVRSLDWSKAIPSMVCGYRL
jgi:hypothetical protein